MEPHGNEWIRSAVRFLDSLVGMSTVERAGMALAVSATSHITKSWPETPFLALGLVLLAGTVLRWFRRQSDTPRRHP
jgi:hypothetical protein